MNSRSILWAVVLVSIAIGLLMLRPDTPPPQHVHEAAAEDEEELEVVASVSAPDAGKRQGLETPPRALDSRAEAPVWREVPADAWPQQLPALREDVTGAALVNLERDRMLAIDAHQRFRLTVPQLGETYSVRVQAVRTSGSGSRSIHGHLDDARLHSAVITLGKTGVFGTISTPRGSYTVSGAGDYAWVMATAELRQHVDTTKPDYVVQPTQPRQEG